MTTMDVTGKTQILGIIGSPVEHSLSPAMHNAALAALGLDYVYVPFAVAPRDLAPAVAGLRALGVRGFNVTIPHKTAIMPLLDGISPDAELCGAVNTVHHENGLFIGYNTDGIGFLRSLREDAGFTPEGSAVLMLGAGGAAHGALAALCNAGVARIIVANRTIETAKALIGTFRQKFAHVDFQLSSLERVDLDPFMRSVDLLVNTTSVGMNGTSFNCLDLALMRQNAVVYDMVYTPLETPLLAAARQEGLVCANGLGMLVAQGEASFSIWTGMEPPTGVMKQSIFMKLGISTNP